MQFNVGYLRKLNLQKVAIVGGERGIGLPKCFKAV
jgi:hypothetical protein